MFRKPKRKAVTRDRQPEGGTDEKVPPAGCDAGEFPNDDNEYDNDARTDRNRNAAEREESDEGEGSSSELFRRKKKLKPLSSNNNLLVSSKAPSGSPRASSRDDDPGEPSRDVLHSYSASSVAGGARPSHAELATRAAEHHSLASSSSASASAAAEATAASAGKGPDGIFRNRARNKFAAGPIRAQTHVRVTARFDYQPDICKDYKDTGFCGFGDTCIYLHDRGDTLSGWQIEQAWEEQQKKKRQAQEEEQMRAFAGLQGEAGEGASCGSAAGATVSTTDDGLPFACYLCRQAFTDPVVTNCHHYFCQPCIMDHVRNNSEQCPVCGEDTHSVFNQPAKLIAKMKRVVRSSGAAVAGGGGGSAAAAKKSWQAYYNTMVAPKAAPNGRE
jgi:RING finger protein 113A